jgi:hypothetical protein
MVMVNAAGHQSLPCGFLCYAGPQNQQEAEAVLHAAVEAKPSSALARGTLAGGCVTMHAVPCKQPTGRHQPSLASHVGWWAVLAQGVVTVPHWLAPSCPQVCCMTRET